MAIVRISYEFIRDAMQSQGVRDALRERAERLASRADALGTSEGVEMNCTVETGTRPKGRPVAEVVSEAWEQEYGSFDVDRRRILGRVAAER